MILSLLEAVPGLEVQAGVPLSRYTRFALGGPAAVFASASTESAWIASQTIALQSGMPWVAIGGGTNLVVADAGFPGIVLQYSARGMTRDADAIHVDAGAELNALIDFANASGLGGMESMAGIPGWAGAAIYGNAGAYGQTIADRVRTVRFYDGASIREFDAGDCQFHYRESIFKGHKKWQILSARLAMQPGAAEALAARSAEIRATRDAKFPPSMKCAGSIFKNLLVKNLPPAAQRQVPAHAVRDGKVPAAWFLEQAGAKGMELGGIHVADYHANLIFNDGSGSAAELVELLAELKARVVARFGFRLEEEVQFIGF